jgi:hypothetical protein
MCIKRCRTVTQIQLPLPLLLLVTYTQLFMQLSGIVLPLPLLLSAAPYAAVGYALFLLT